MNLTLSDESHARLVWHAGKVPKLSVSALTRELILYGLGRLDAAEEHGAGCDGLMALQARQSEVEVRVAALERRYH